MCNCGRRVSIFLSLSYRPYIKNESPSYIKKLTVSKRKMVVLYRVCGLSGSYYCSDCFETDPTKEQWVIPARIIHNWDFRQYSVSNNAANFLQQTQLYPLFDIYVINKKIYGAVEEMRRLKVIPRVVCVSRNISLLYLFNNILSYQS